MSPPRMQRRLLCELQRPRNHHCLPHPRPGPPPSSYRLHLQKGLIDTTYNQSPRSRFRAKGDRERHVLPPLRTGRATSLCRTIPFKIGCLLRSRGKNWVQGTLRGIDVEDKVDQPIPSPTGGLHHHCKILLEEHQAAFDAAVSTYRARNRDLSEKAARRMGER